MCICEVWETRVYVCEGARCRDEVRGKAFSLSLLMGNASFERQHLI